jgi:hypothetical protein
MKGKQACPIMKFKTWLRLEFYKDTVINEVSPYVQTSSGLLILQQDDVWSGSFDHAKLFSWNKARRFCDKTNKRLREYGKKHGKPYSVYNPVRKKSLLSPEKENV